MIPLALSYDHRVIDGAEGARFMAELHHVLSNIMEMLLSLKPKFWLLVLDLEATRQHLEQLT